MTQPDSRHIATVIATPLTTWSGNDEIESRTNGLETRKDRPDMGGRLESGWIEIFVVRASGETGRFLFRPHFARSSSCLALKMQNRLGCPAWKISIFPLAPVMQTGSVYFFVLRFFISCNAQANEFTHKNLRRLITTISIYDRNS
jgi:hypothetical protein